MVRIIENYTLYEIIG
jgi:serine/threonine-protein kinase ULK/ATG1